MQIVTGRRGEPHVTSRQVQAVYRSFLGDFALLDIGEHLRAEATAIDNVRIYDGVVAVQGIYAVIAYNEYDDNYIEPVSVGKKRIDTIVLHYTKDSLNDIENMQIEVVEGEEATDNPVAPTVTEGGDAWEGTASIQVPIYDVLVDSFSLTITPRACMTEYIPTLSDISERIPTHAVTGVKGDSETSYRYGDVNITKANIGLGNVDNTADTDKPISTAMQSALDLKASITYVNNKVASAYHAGGSKTVAELTSALLIADNIGKVYNMSDSGTTTSDFVEGAGEPINEGDNVGICNVGTEENPVYKFDLLSGFVDLSAYATTSAMNTALADKVDKEAGKGLSTNDYTNNDVDKLRNNTYTKSESDALVEANPSDAASGTLSKLKVGNTVYNVPQGGGGGSTVTITPTLQSGTKIADYSIDGTSGSLYAPQGGGTVEKTLYVDTVSTSGSLAIIEYGFDQSDMTEITHEQARNPVTLDSSIQIQYGYGGNYNWRVTALIDGVNATIGGVSSTLNTGQYVEWSYDTSVSYTFEYTTGEVIDDLSDLHDVDLTTPTNGQVLKYNGTSQKWENKNDITVDSSMSTTSENPLQNKVITAELAGTKTTNGNPITVTDAAPVNAVNLSMDLEPIQDLHGYDHPWVGGAGKNKLPMTVDGIKAANTSGTWSGNTYSVYGVSFTILTDGDDNVTGISVNGSHTENLVFILAKNMTFDIDMTISGTSTTNAGCMIEAYADGSYYSDQVGYTSVIPTNKTIDILYVVLLANRTANNDVVYPMLRDATISDADFAPYSNICPISGRSEVEIDRVGKNLFDENGTQTTTYGTATIDGEKITCTGTYYARIALDLPAGIYTVSCEVLSFSTSKGIRLFYDDNTYSDTVISSGTIDTNGKRVIAVLLYCGDGTSATTVYQNIQIEKGNTATTYEPYAGKTYTIQFGQTVYGGKLDVVTGKLRVTHGEVDLGELGWAYNSQYNFFVSNSLTGFSGMDYGFITSYYKNDGAKTDANMENATNGCIYNWGKTIKVKDTRYTDAIAFKTAVTGQKLVYELATPITIPLTPQQIKLLENTNTLYTDYEGDTIHIEYQPNNAIGEAVRAAEENLDAELLTRPQLKRYSTRLLCDGFSSENISITTDKKIIPLFARFDAEYTELYIDYEPRFYNPLVYYVDGTAYINYQASGIPSDNQQRTFEMYYYEV